ncbi:hypothetical protein NKH69_33710 [Mesorhizobium sp. M0976]|uniref:hypothetical protein n=1 Tax=Mesorhizobium sp. M0976 TaxID=2957038 RepID=UPI00333B93F9
MLVLELRMPVAPAGSAAAFALILEVFAQLGVQNALQKRLLRSSTNPLVANTLF